MSFFPLYRVRIGSNPLYGFLSSKPTIFVLTTITLKSPGEAVHSQTFSHELHEFLSLKYSQKVNWLAHDIHHLEYTKETVEKLDTLVLGAVDPRKSRTWNENIRIPNVDFPVIDGISIIQIAHLLDVSTSTYSFSTILP